MRTYVCAKDSVRHLGVSERQGEKQRYQGALLPPAPTVLAGAPLPIPVCGRGPRALPACGRTSRAIRAHKVLADSCDFGAAVQLSPSALAQGEPVRRRDGTAQSLLGLYYTNSFILL